MRREDKVRTAATEAWVAKHEADHARYFAFLDKLNPPDRPANALMKEFGIGLGEAHAAWLHWLVLGHERHLPPLERARMMGGM